jgi:SAM-dependent methyltransferase
VTDGAPDWPAAGLEPVPACPVCGSDRRELLYDDLADRTWFSAGGGWALHRCLECTAGYLDPRPDRETIGRAYASYYTHERPQADAQTAGVRGAMRNGYLNARYGYEFSPASRLGSLLAWLFPKKRSYADRSVRNLRRPSGGGRLLDIGCGEGSFLAEMREAGWDGQGIEPDTSAAALARENGIPIIGEPLDQAELPAGSFDAVTMNHVIEHFHDPIEALRISYRLLQPGGTLWIVTPNLTSRGHQLFGRDWVGLDPPRHLVLFTRAALERAVTSTGFEVDRYGSDYSAQTFFPCSATIAAGEDPREEETVARHRDRRSALIGDLAARIDRGRAENIVLIARATPDR